MEECQCQCECSVEADECSCQCGCCQGTCSDCHCSTKRPDWGMSQRQARRKQQQLKHQQRLEQLAERRAKNSPAPTQD